MNSIKLFVTKWYPIILAFLCMLYSISWAFQENMMKHYTLHIGQEQFFCFQLQSVKEEDHERWFFYHRWYNFCSVHVFYDLEYLLLK